MKDETRRIQKIEKERERERERESASGHGGGKSIHRDTVSLAESGIESEGSSPSSSSHEVVCLEVTTS